MQRAFVGHPVDVVSGGVYTAWHDFGFSGRTAITWRRFYSTGVNEVSAHGVGWTTEYFSRLERQGADLVLAGSEGHSHTFRQPLPDSASRIHGHRWRLSQSENGYRLFDGSRQKYLHFSASVARPDIFLLRRIADVSGHSAYLHYDAYGRLTEIEQRSLGRHIQFSYTDADLIEQVHLLVAGHEPLPLASYAYDDRMHLVVARDPAGGEIRYVYDEDHRMVRETNKLGASFEFEYDALGRCTTTAGDNGYLRRTLVYDAKQRRTTVTDSIGGVTRYDYTPDGSISAITNSLGHVTRFVRLGGIEQRVNADGVVTENEFNDRGELIRKSDASGRSFLFTYNQRSQITSITDPGGAVWCRRYDERGLMTHLSDPVGHEWTLDRGSGGEIVSQTDPEGRTLKRRYDPGMRWQEISDGRGYFRTEYDTAGRPIITANPDGLINTWRYDAAGRLIQKSYADGASEEYAYNAAGQIIRQKDPTGAIWAFGYDGFGNLVSACDPMGGEVKLEYNTEGRRTRVRNQRGELYEDVYDVLSRVTKRTYFDGSTDCYEWNAVGTLASIHRANGAVITRAYDVNANMTREEATFVHSDDRAGVPPETLASDYAYDWRGYVTRAANAMSEIAFNYDLGGRLVGEQQGQFLISYRYDASGKLAGRELKGGPVGEVGFSYDSSGALDAITDAKGVVQRFTYGRGGEMRERGMRDGIDEELTYDKRQRIASQVVRQRGTPVSVREYRFDQRDNLAQLTDDRRGTSLYRYDPARRLVELERRGVVVDSFRYDQGGNTIVHNSDAWRHGPGGRLQASADEQYEYDATGNQTVRQRSDEQVKSEYDALGRLIRTYTNGELTCEYGYDPLNRRMYKSAADATTTRYIWSNRTLAAINESDGGTVELLVSGAGWRPTVAWNGSDAEHYICNHLGLPQEVVNEKHGLVWSADVAPFGRASVNCKTPSPAYDLRFPGQIEDHETGLHYNWHRYYDPRQGRYTTPDPAGIDAGINLFDYPRDPINWTDPMGLSCPNPVLIEENAQWGWQIHEHADGTLVITADCTRGFATPKPGGLRATIHAGSNNAANPPEAHLGLDGRLIVMEGTHRSAAASRGQQMPPDPDNPHLGGVPGQPGYMRYEYSPDYNDDQPGVPLQSLTYPPGYPHTL